MRLLTVIPIAKGIAVETLTYFSSVDAAPGSIVRAPLRKKEVPALVVESRDAAEMKSEIRGADYELKKIDPKSVRAFLRPEFIVAAARCAFWHAASTGSMLDALVPALLLEHVERHPAAATGAMSTPIAAAPANSPHHDPASERLQEHYIIQADDEERLAQYRSIIREAFARRSSVFLSLPSIQDIENVLPRIEKGIEDYRYAFHSELGKKEFAAAYEKLLAERHPVLLVATPAFLSLPRADISTIIVEKEGARGYKTQSRPYADLRVFAEHFAEATGAKLIFGDSFLQTETMHRYQMGELHELYAPKFRSISPATVEIVDVRPRPDGQDEQASERKKFSAVGDALGRLAERTHSHGEHLFVFAARKGLSPTTVCADCGTIVVCSHCGNPVVLHGATRTAAPDENESIGTTIETRRNFFLCHTCGERRSALELCRTCGGWRLVPLGVGIERVALELKARVPGAPLFVLTKEDASTRKKALAIVADFYTTPGSILLGTEIALPYLDRRIENAAIASIDSFFAIPDFKIPERALGLMLTLRTLALRRMIIQTRMPDQPVFRHIVDGNLADFYRDELALRKAFGYPPFTMLVKLSIEGERDAIAARMAEAKELFAGDEFDVFPSFIKGRSGKSVLNGLLRVPRKRWPDAAIIATLISLQPQFTVKVDPESLL